LAVTDTEADAVYLAGTIWPGGLDEAVGAEVPTALAVARGRIMALGSDDEVRSLVGRRTTVVDLGGRRVIPGLIDGHLHAVRAGTTWDQELHWTEITDLGAALASIAGALTQAAPGQWIRVVGGWHPSQFRQRRSPTRVELDQLSSVQPIYLQALYDHAVLNSAAFAACGFDHLLGDPAGGSIERDHDGRPTGVVRGMGAFAHCLAAMGVGTAAQEREATGAMTRDLHASGLTGVVDPGGFGMSPDRYEPLFELWRAGQLTMRIRLFLSAVDPGREHEQVLGWLRHSQTRFGDGMLQVLGVGEIVHFGCHDVEGLEPFTITDDAESELGRISEAAARRRWPMHIHAVLDTSVDRILHCWEQVAAEHPIGDLRWSVAHADRISQRNIERLAALGAGILVDDHLALSAPAAERAWGAPALEHAPPLGDLAASGIPIAAGTDGTRASSWNPWLALWWLTVGQSVDGEQRRNRRHCLSRRQALHAYTAGSAYLSFEEDRRGHLRVGADADFAVLNQDYFAAPDHVIPTITSLLTVVGGVVVHSSGQLAPSTP